MDKITVGSLFSGIGGMDLGLERAGMEIKWQVEIDPYCRRVLAKHWPDVERFEDVREVGAHNLEPVDLICGGFPCQDISILGKRSGLSGEHSGLWSEFSRVICELRPRFALVENSPSVLTRGMAEIQSDLASIEYDSEGDCIPAAALGADHLRARQWILAYPFSFGDRLEKKTIFAGRERIKHSDWWASEPGICRVDDGVPSRVDRLRGLGNAVVPQVAEYIGECIVGAVNG